ncbi:hypothetical protein TOK_3192 [Pseudonocardia sp. N23]|nr:hypothetical protein TOK_3192 [Pseudonocardia sp. N23]
MPAGQGTPAPQIVRYQTTVALGTTRRPAPRHCPPSAGIR